MSDFDKEAEREKLREKYERDEEKREATEQMSELLLQGATMTNAHCSDCGDPIFRYDGQEFCATCEKPVDRGRDENDESEGQQGIQVTSPSEDARVKFGSQDEPDETVGNESRRGPDQGTAQQGEPAQTATGDAQRHSDGQDHHTARDSQERQTAPEPSAVETGGTADISAARESLVRTLTRFSQQAEATEDPQQAAEYLAAAREAAETLSALKQ